MMNYILDENDNPVLEPDVIKWAKWISDNPYKKSLCKTHLPNGVWISTVFLGLDHSFIPGIPVLWETMIFNGEHDSYQERYSSKEDALVGHLKALDIARGIIKDE